MLSTAATAAIAVLSASTFLFALPRIAVVDARPPDRSRLVKLRHNVGIYTRHRDNGRPIEGGAYHAMTARPQDAMIHEKLIAQERQSAQDKMTQRRQLRKSGQRLGARGREIGTRNERNYEKENRNLFSLFPKEDRRDGSLQQTLYHDNGDVSHRQLGQLTGCCYDYQGSSAANLCSAYGQDCESGAQNSHDDGDSSCSQDGLSFIGVSFSVNTVNGNPYSYQLNDQFPMENIIDRDYTYIMSMDEDGWLVGGGYKQFDYSGKMPYIDSSHTEIVRIGSMDTSKG